MTQQIEGEFPEILPIKESLIKYVFEPNAAKVRVKHTLRHAVLPWVDCRHSFHGFSLKPPAQLGGPKQLLSLMLPA